MDKYKSCENCPDRTVEPNCHTTCEGYLFRCEQNRKKKERKKEDTEFNSFKKSRVDDMKKKLGLFK